MSEDALLERANRVIAESERLIDDLRRSIWRGQRLDEGLRDLHERRLEEESRSWSRRNGFGPIRRRKLHVSLGDKG
jgi:hypothetical protein